MIIILVHLLLIGYQSPQSAPNHAEEKSELAIWEEIATLERMVLSRVNAQSDQFNVYQSDPVRGYYVDRMGVYLIIPVRYRYQRNQSQAENGAFALPSQNSEGLNQKDLNQQIRQWREMLQKESVNKDAEFEKVIGGMREMLPEIAKQLKHLSPEENLTVVIEEREPAWSMAGFRLNEDDSRKLVTLRVVKEALAEVYSRETTFSTEWMGKVKRTNSKRPIIP